MKFSFQPENYFNFRTGQIFSPSFRIGEDIPQEINPYDPEKIAVVLLDEHLQETSEIQYFDTLADASTYISGDGSERYAVYIGRNAGITSITNDFKGRTKLSKITIPESVTAITSRAFETCTNLKTVKLKSDSLTEIPAYTFKSCTNLQDINLPSSVTAIGAYAFYGCSSLSGITIPSGISTIETYAFSGSGLVSLSIHAADVSIRDLAFQNCSDLEELSLSGVTSIGDGVFPGCTDLISVDYDGTEVGRTMFSGCSLLSNVSLGQNVSKVGIDAFSGCTNISSIDLLYAKIISNYAFRNCTGLTSVSIGSQIETIANRAFYGCTQSFTISIDAATDSVAGKPWGATNAVVNWA